MLSPKKLINNRAARFLPALAAVGGVLGGVGKVISATRGDSKQVSGLELHPTYELDLLDFFETSMTDINAERGRLTEADAGLNDKINTLQGVLNNSIAPADAIRGLRDSATRIATAIGQSTEELVAGGFLSGSDAELLAGGKGGDPRIERQIDDERARLEQDLARAGVSPAGRAQAMSQFEAQAKEQRFSGNIGLGQIRQQNQATALQGLAGVQSEASRQVGLGQIQAQHQQGLRQEGMKSFSQLGEFLLSGKTQGQLGRGQTGIARLDERITARNGVASRNADNTKFADLGDKQLKQKRVSLTATANNFRGNVSNPHSPQNQLDELTREEERRGIR